MAVVNVYEAKTHLSRLLRRVRAGESVVIADAGRPVARLVPFEPESGPRKLGGDRGKIWIADDFDGPLPDEIVDAFYGDVAPPSPRRLASTVSRAAAVRRRRGR